ncbi:MAG: hypothetical protein FWC42_07365 [Proteobacteria bacterium]|nr:hypothetical protein [Pseudomonadota bacterium]
MLTFRSAVLLPAAALVFLLTTPVRAVEYIDYTDLWIDANPPINSGMGGFGINFIQSGNSFDFIFATFYIYDPVTGKPDWVTGQLEREAGKTSFTGNIYRTQSDPTSGPFVPKNTVTASIGTVKFTPASSTTGTLLYTVDKVTTTLDLKRFTLTETILDGSYWGQASIRRTGCTSSGNNGTTSNKISLEIEKKTGSTQATYTFTIANYNCTMSGALIQEGRFQKINGASYVCYLGSDKMVNSTADLFNIAATTQGMEGEWTSNKGLDGCKEETHFAAVIQP